MNEGSTMSWKVGLLKIADANGRSVLFLDHINQPWYLECLQKIDETANFLFVPLLDILRDRSCVFWKDISGQFWCLFFIDVSISDEQRYFRSDSEIVLDLLPTDEGSLGSDWLGCLFDNFCNLVLQSVFGGYVLFGVDSQLISSAFLLPHLLLGLVFMFDEMLSIATESGFLVEVIFKRASDWIYDVVLVNGASVHGHLIGHCFFWDGVVLFLAENYFQKFFLRIFVPAVILKFLWYNFLNQSHQSIEIDPNSFSMRQHQRSFETIPETSATLSEGKRVEIHVRNKCEDAIRKIGLYALDSDAFIDKSAEKLFWVVEGNVVFLVVFMREGLNFGLECWECAQDSCEPFVF